jgi:hypothetical protein
MTAPVAPPAGPANAKNPSTQPSRAPQDPRRGARFAALLKRSARGPAAPPDSERRAAPLPRRREAGVERDDERGRGGAEPALEAALANGMPSGFAPSVTSVATPAAATTSAAPSDAVEGVAALAARFVESVQVGLDRAGQAEVRFDVADGPLKGLEVQLRATAGGIEASFVAEDAASRRALVAPLQELQRTLADQGITVARLEVAVRADVGGGGSRHGANGDGAASEALVAPGAARGGRGGSAAFGGAAGLPLLRAGSATDWIA